jgi:hypothetical protein
MKTRKMQTFAQTRGNMPKISITAGSPGGFFRQRLRNFALVNIQSKIQILVLTASL